MIASQPNGDTTDRQVQKQALRDEDAARLRAGQVSPADLRRANHVLSSVDLSSFRMVSIGKRRLSSAK